MPKALEVNWLELQAEYQRGKLSCREIAEKHGLSPAAVSKRCVRDKWNVQKHEIVSRVTASVVQELSKDLVPKAESWVKETLSRCQRARKDVDEIRSTFPLTITRLEEETKIEARVDGIARRSLGLADTPQIVSVSSDSPEFQAQILARLDAVKSLLSTGKIDPKTIDVEATVQSGVDKTD